MNQMHEDGKATAVSKPVASGRTNPGKTTHAKQPPAAGPTPAPSTQNAKKAEEPSPKTKPENPIDLLRKLVERANAGEQWAIQRLRRVLDDNPGFWGHAGDLTAFAEEAWIQLMAGPDLLAVEAVKRKLNELKKELKGSHPTRMESLLVDTIAMAWLGSHHAELQASSPTTGSLQQAAWRLKRSESSQKRLLSAAKTLATLRTLMSRGLAPLHSVKLFSADGTG